MGKAGARFGTGDLRRPRVTPAREVQLLRNATVAVFAVQPQRGVARSPRSRPGRLVLPRRVRRTGDPPASVARAHTTAPRVGEGESHYGRWQSGEGRSERRPQTGPDAWLFAVLRGHRLCRRPRYRACGTIQAFTAGQGRVAQPHVMQATSAASDACSADGSDQLGKRRAGRVRPMRWLPGTDIGYLSASGRTSETAASARIRGR